MSFTLTQTTLDRQDRLFAKFVPKMGICETFEGELLRAACRIQYRCYNDGDYFFSGYGVETAGSAALFLMKYAHLLPGVMELFEQAEKNGAYEREYDAYCELTTKIVELVMDYIESKTEFTPNVQNCVSDFRDKAEQTWDKNDGYEDDYDEYYEEDEYDEEDEC